MAKAFTAGGTIRCGRFVKKGTGNHDVLEADANELVEGISGMQGRTAPLPTVTTDPVEAAQSGEQVLVYTPLEGDCLLQIGSGGVVRGDELMSDADGKGVVRGSTANTLYNIGAVALEDASENEFCKVTPRIYVHSTAT